MSLGPPRIGRKYASESKETTTLRLVHQMGTVHLHAGTTEHKAIIPGKRYLTIHQPNAIDGLTIGPEHPVLHMCHNFLPSHGIWYHGVSSVFINTPQNKFRLLCGQEIILIRKRRDQKPCHYSRRQGDEAFNDL